MELLTYAPRKLLLIAFTINITMLLLFALAPKPVKAWPANTLPDCTTSHLPYLPEEPTQADIEELFNLSIDWEKPYFVVGYNDGNADYNLIMYHGENEPLNLVSIQYGGNHIHSYGTVNNKFIYDDGTEQATIANDWGGYSGEASCFLYANELNAGNNELPYPATVYDRQAPEPPESEEPEEPTPPAPTDGRPDAALTFGNKIGIITSFAAGGYIIWLLRFREPRH